MLICIFCQFNRRYIVNTYKTPYHLLYSPNPTKNIFFITSHDPGVFTYHKQVIHSTITHTQYSEQCILYIPSIYPLKPYKEYLLYIFSHTEYSLPHPLISIILHRISPQPTRTSSLLP